MRHAVPSRNTAAGPPGRSTPTRMSSGAQSTQRTLIRVRTRRLSSHGPARALGPWCLDVTRQAQSKRGATVQGTQ